jgi:hypothetical protein
MKKSKQQRFLVAGWIALVLILAPGLTLAGENDTNWFVSFTRIPLPPVDRNDTSQLIEAGRLETDGFSELVFCLGGEFKEAIPSHGVVGAVLIPDIEVFQYLFRDEGQFVFPLEVKIDVSAMQGAIFISDQQTAKVAFPAYRVFLYNETESGAMASFFAYRTR